MNVQIRPDPLADPNTTKLTVFYDGACPICQREIGFYRRQRGASTIAWIDISRLAPDLVLAEGLDVATALRRFHVLRPDGRIVGGGGAFAEVWDALPGWRWLGRLARPQPVRAVLDLGYRAFLKIRPRVQRLFR